MMLRFTGRLRRIKRVHQIFNSMNLRRLFHRRPREASAALYRQPSNLAQRVSQAPAPAAIVRGGVVQTDVRGALHLRQPYRASPTFERPQTICRGDQSPDHIFRVVHSERGSSAFQPAFIANPTAR